MQLGVERAHGRLGEVDRCGRRALQPIVTAAHAYTRSGSGSQIRALSIPGSSARARNSEAIATHASVSAMIAGLQAIASRTTAKPSPLVTSSV